MAHGLTEYENIHVLRQNRKGKISYLKEQLKPSPFPVQKESEGKLRNMNK